VSAHASPSETRRFCSSQSGKRCLIVCQDERSGGSTLLTLELTLGLTLGSMLDTKGLAFLRVTLLWDAPRTDGRH